MALAEGLYQWGIVHAPAAATIAVISKAAVPATTSPATEASQGGVAQQQMPAQRHVCTGICVSIGGTGANATPVGWRLRDGAAGAGTILAQGQLSNVANSGDKVVLSGLNLAGSLNSAMTLETDVTAANSTAIVSLQGYTES